MKLTDLLEEYVLECTIKGYSKNSLRNIKESFKDLLSVLGDLKLDDVKRIHLKRYISAKQEVNKANSINTRINILRPMFKFAVDEDLIESNPFDKIKLLKEEKLVIKTYSKEDVKKMLNFYNKRDFQSIRNKTVLTMFVETGIRSSELRNITLSDVYEDSIRIKGKGSKVRFVPISLPLKKQMMRYLRIRSTYLGDTPCDFYFVSKTRKQLHATIPLAIVEGVDMPLSIKPTIHSFRRYYIQTMIEHTDLYTVSRLVGHTKITTTEGYLRSTSDDTILQRGMKSPLSR